MPKKAVQQIMLGTVTRNETEALQTLSAVKAAGYDSIELNGFMIHKTSFLVRMMTKAAGMPVGKGGSFDWKGLLSETGLSVCSLHQDLGSIKRDPDAVIREAKEFGTEYVVITGMYRFDYTDQTALGGLVKDLNSCGEKLAAGGIKLLYHNHNCEFLKLPDGRTAYQLLVDETEKALVNFELDTYWPTEAGVSALTLMKGLGNRMKLWHINDRGSRTKGTVMTPILTSDSMELGTGNMELENLLEQALLAEVDTIVLESHKNWIDGSPVRSLQMSGEWLGSHLLPSV